MSIIITIDLGDGRTDDLKIAPNANLNLVAKNFCAKHHLPPESSEILIAEIIKNTTALKSEVQSSPSPQTPQKVPQYSNVGVKLYERGQKYMEIIANKIQKFKKMREENEQKNLTFSPAVNKSKYASGYEILLRAGLQTEQKLEKMRGEKLNKEINSCTFSPKINRKSAGIGIKRKSMTPEFSTSFGSSAATSWNL